MVDFETLEHVAADLPAEEFYDRFVKTRTPCILDSPIKDAEWQSGGSWTDLEYLASKAGHSMLMIEPFHKDMNQYGTAIQRQRMSLQEFLDILTSTKASATDANGLYLTTQYEGQDAEAALSPPCDCLASDFPLVPELMGNLTLQQVNLWLGKAPKQGSSSGLHHDFADNLYVLLQGKKRFTLFPPSAAPHLSTYGQLEHIHDNGLVSYLHAPTRSDGLDSRSAAQIKADALEQQLSKMKASPGIDVAAVAQLEEALEEAQDELMGQLVAHPGLEDEGDDLDQLAFDGQGDAGFDDFEEMNGEDLEVGAGGPEPEVEGPSSEEDDGEPTSNGFDELSAEPLEAPKEPASFSRISAPTLHACLNGDKVDDKEAVEGLQKAGKPVQIELKQGEMLYLPASWFHEVTSLGDGSDVHMAFNYWFFPPNGPGFAEPYADGVVWDVIRQERRAEYEEAKHADRKGKRKRRESDDSKKDKKW